MEGQRKSRFISNMAELGELYMVVVTFGKSEDEASIAAIHNEYSAVISNTHLIFLLQLTPSISTLCVSTKV